MSKKIIINKSKQNESDDESDNKSNNESEQYESDDESEQYDYKSINKFLEIQTTIQLRRICRMIGQPFTARSSDELEKRRTIGVKEMLINNIMCNEYKLNDIHDKLNAFTFCSNLSSTQQTQLVDMLDLYCNAGDDTICSIIKYTRTYNNLLQIINDIKNKKYYIKCFGKIIKNETDCMNGCTRTTSCDKCRSTHTYCTNNKVFRKSECEKIGVSGYNKLTKYCEICNKHCNMQQSINEFYQIILLNEIPQFKLMKHKLVSNIDLLSDFLDCLLTGKKRMIASMMGLSLHGVEYNITIRIIDNEKKFNKELVNIFLTILLKDDLKKICTKLYIMDKGTKHNLTREIINYLFE